MASNLYPGTTGEPGWPELHPLAGKHAGPRNPRVVLGLIKTGDRQRFGKIPYDTNNLDELNRRLRLEAAYLAELNIPGLMGIPTTEMMDERVVLTWSYTRGMSLLDALTAVKNTSHAARSLPARICIIRQLLEIMREVHAQQKHYPQFFFLLLTYGLENIWLTHCGELRIAGLAEVIGEGFSELPETWSPLKAPELIIEGHPVDHRADIFAAGILIFQLLTLRPVISDFQLDAKIVYRLFRNVHPLVSDVDADLAKFDPVVARALQWLPERRYQSVDELLDAVLDAVHLIEPLGTGDTQVQLKDLYDSVIESVINDKPGSNRSDSSSSDGIDDRIARVD